MPAAQLAMSHRLDGGGEAQSQETPATDGERKMK